MNTKRVKLYYKVIAVISMGFLLLGISFTIHMLTSNKAKSSVYFRESAEGMRTMLADLIKSNVETLDGVAITIGEMEVTDLTHLLPVLREINDRNSFFRMGFIHADGKGDMVDLDGTVHRNVDVAEQEYFKRAMTGVNTISTSMKDEYSGQYLNYYGVPVNIRGETVGVLAAADRSERLRTILDTSMFSRGGYSNVIDKNGVYVLRSMKSPEITHVRDMGDFTEDKLEQLLAELEAGVDNFIEYEKDGNKSWAIYLPLEYNDWFLLSIVEEDVVNGDYYSIVGIILLIASAMVIFALLAFIMNRLQMKNEAQLEVLAYVDSLLGIDNFTKFSMDADKMLKLSEFRQLAFWYADIDDFKIYNESFGYDAGDQLLKSIAEILKDHSNPGEMFCRENSDHFVGIRYFSKETELVSWYEQLSENLERRELCDKKSFRPVLSMGFYCAQKPEALLTINEMYNRARMAQKSIKQIKNIKYAFYSDDLRRQILKDNEIEARMKDALASGCFKVYIQPKVAILEDNRIAGGEALVRWQDPVRGIINPGDFIPLFERNGFIIPLDRYMFAAVCRWLRDYLDGGGRPIRLAVNVSRLGILQEDFLDYYAGTKAAYEIPDGMLELEFTESLAIEDNDILRKRIEELGGAGFVCSLDDFGAGYSSLNTLKDLPIQVLKLDMLFFRKGADEKRSQIIVGNVIHMAKQLNIRIVAEGVEAVDQVDFLRECGCDIVQGFVFERPMPADDFRRLLRSEPSGGWGAGFPKYKVTTGGTDHGE